MNIKIPSAIIRLADVFPCTLYAVGGFVRDSLLGYPQHDVDICGQSTPDEVIDALRNTEFSVSVGSKKLLTLIISYGKYSYEYTTFRKDSYTTGHRPTSVTHTTDIYEDASRRDFKINAIYYDIKNKVLVDPLGGLGDLNSKILNTTRAPQDVFREDGLRLMRLARFAASLGFTPTEDTLVGARENAARIDEISVERIRDELDRILIADTYYGKQYAQKRGLEILENIGVLKRILPELTDGIGMAQRSDFHKYDVFGHILETVKFAPPDIRLAALMHDVAKPYCKITTGKYFNHQNIGAEMTRRILSKYRYPNKVIDETARLVEHHMYNLLNDAKDNTLRAFIQKNYDILPKLIELKYADYYGSGLATNNIVPCAERLASLYKEMKEENTPFSVKDLLINGNDLEKIPELPPELRGKALNALLTQCAYENNPYNTSEKQLFFIKNYIKEIKNGLAH